MVRGVEIPTAFEAGVFATVSPFTMTSAERVACLCRSIEYIERLGLPGAIVECGVWKGGSMMAAALSLLNCGNDSRELVLFDTFAGMPPPTDHDRDLAGRAASDLLRASGQEGDLVRAVGPIEIVRAALECTKYPLDRVRFVQGLVEETVPEEAPKEIALLRLDTDWYTSTKHELEHLFPRLVEGGILIIDDFGHWKGAKRATIEYFGRYLVARELHSIDYTGRLLIKRR